MVESKWNESSQKGFWVCSQDGKTVGQGVWIKWIWMCK